MKIAFTAPMKPLDHPVPSGDRTMGRLIVKALEVAGHDMSIASTFRSWRKEGSREIQQEVERDALKEADRIADDWSRQCYRPDVFLTYHLYHKAPDWIGPALCERLDLPYAVVEASRAPKRQTGNWAYGFAAADNALKRADAVAAIHNADAECLRAVVPESHLEVLLPFLDAAPFQKAAAVTRKAPASTPLKLLTVAMMREGDKMRSYEVLAAALDRLADLPWHLTIVGDGPAREHVLKLFPARKMTWAGAAEPEQLPDFYAQSDLLVWPAIREAFGLVFLEAQASGTGVIAGNTFGVPDIVRDSETGLLSAEGDAEAFAASLARVIEDPALADRMGHAAGAHIQKHHTLAAGGTRLEGLLQTAIRNHAHGQKGPAH
ncbi:glycosyltransferase family 4 protein [uncultured Roseibium sp.]|uniref:glycosyltransferase family 4 protein n=1 Tax=uncultured Roseibium sp. TaxID=1936171 RepID=UPI00261FA0A4|nr:glycosyltransferase family 4 protein [uncultured Roseibium sp.]